jgi:hypothetical protein
LQNANAASAGIVEAAGLETAAAAAGQWPLTGANLAEVGDSLAAGFFTVK